VIACVDSGLCSAIVQQNPNQEGVEAVNELKSLIDGNPAKVFIDVPVAIVTQANVEPYRAMFP
jgi:ribose transport system substrate-binding protein